MSAEWKAELEKWVADHKEQGIEICSIDEESKCVILSLNGEQASLTIPSSKEDYFVSASDLFARLTNLHLPQFVDTDSDEAIIRAVVNDVREYVFAEPPTAPLHKLLDKVRNQT